MHADERKDYESALRDNDYSVCDFIFNEKNTTNYDLNGMALITGSVTIKRISTQKEKDYKTGNFTSWIADFDNDLKQGLYG